MTHCVVTLFKANVILIVNVEYQFACFQNTVCHFVEKGKTYSVLCEDEKTTLFLPYILTIVTFNKNYLLRLKIVKKYTVAGFLLYCLLSSVMFSTYLNIIISLIFNILTFCFNLFLSYFSDHTLHIVSGVFGGIIFVVCLICLVVYR